MPLCARATGQVAERLIVDRDTLQMYYLPLSGADETVRGRLQERLRSVEASYSTACWRGYVGLWRLDRDGMLWLERIDTEEGRPVMTGAELLPREAAGTCARALWVSDTVRCGSGRTVYYQHDGFLRHNEREWKFVFRSGRIAERHFYNNHVYDSGVDPLENARRMAAMYASVRLADVPDDLSFSVRFAADSTGQVVRIDTAWLKVPCRDPNARGPYRTIRDPQDPLLAEALRVFRTGTRWNTWRIDGAWKEQEYFFPLRRNDKPWQPRQSGAQGRP